MEFVTEYMFTACYFAGQKWIYLKPDLGQIKQGFQTEAVWDCLFTQNLTLCSHYLFDQIPVVMWDFDDTYSSRAGSSHAVSNCRNPGTQLLQPHRLLFQEKRVLREAHHWVRTLSLTL